MPYASIEELPPSVANYLPTHAQELYRAALNNAWNEYWIVASIGRRN